MVFQDGIFEWLIHTVVRVQNRELSKGYRVSFDDEGEERYLFLALLSFVDLFPKFELTKAKSTILVTSNSSFK